MGTRLTVQVASLDLTAISPKLQKANARSHNRFLPAKETKKPTLRIKRGQAIKCKSIRHHTIFVPDRMGGGSRRLCVCFAKAHRRVRISLGGHPAPVGKGD